MKKLFFMFLLTLLCANITFGDETAKNSISGGANFFYCFFLGKSGFLPPGLSIEYERMLGNKFSVGAEIGGSIGGNIGILPYVEIRGRYYPWSKMFFIGVGLGICIFAGYQWYSIFNEDGTMEGIRTWETEIFPSASLEFGWKIDIGKTKKWLLLPSAAGVVVFDYFYPEFIARLNMKIGYKF